MESSVVEKLDGENCYATVIALLLIQSACTVGFVLNRKLVDRAHGEFCIQSGMFCCSFILLVVSCSQKFIPFGPYLKNI